MVIDARASDHFVLSVTDDGGVASRDVPVSEVRDAHDAVQFPALAAAVEERKRDGRAILRVDHDTSVDRIAGMVDAICASHCDVALSCDAAYADAAFP
jgi:hypothetical protein